MTTNVWEARRAEFERVKAKLTKPSWARRIAGVSARLTKPDCFKCGGEDFMHSLSCTRRGSFQNAEIAFGNAVIKAAAKHAEHLRGEEIMAQLKAAIPDWRRTA